MRDTMVEDKAIQENDEVPENGAPEPHESNPVDSVKEKVQTLLENTPTDFGAWALLLSEIEKTSPDDIQKICLVYDAFLSEFPLCYGYWKKYASHKARLCTLYEVEELYERALRVATYSVDLWVSYCSFALLSYEDPVDIRRLYERGLSFVGKDYLCHLLWDKYIEFEYSQKQWSRLAHIYINTLRYPIKKLHSYYESFKKLVATWEEEIECQKDTEMSSEIVSNCGTENVKDCGYAEISNAIRDLLNQQDGLPRPNAVKKYLDIGELFYQRSNQLDRKISYFEAQIRRPYFHVKPLDDRQLQNWHQYLDFVEMQGDFDWAVKLYERCLIPCANYSEFWIRYVEFVDAKGGREIAQYALDRALTVFLKRVPAFHLYCTMFKEQIGDVCGARALFHRSIMDSDPEFIENVNREANMEKRMGNIDAACMIYEKAIEMAKEKHILQILPVLYTNFAQFTMLARGSIDAAREVFVKGIQQMPNKSIIEGLIRFITIHGRAEQIPKLDTIVANAIVPESDVSKAFSSQDCEDISKLFLEFVDLHGTIHDIRMAWSRHRKLFPHIMRPSFNYTVPEKNTLDKSKEGRNQMLVFSISSCLWR
ncbi:pre-mRNA-processing factor 39-like isoform X1 [Phoenix dactylifera]|uniref:Pre-mRNA-processing factor 39-like isoform X1 n=1 Tax=Phoenix dactylifera TaxID=42345 RepID=A0A8B9AUE2_PHODC|nr:pre-mRNA-processing factor 39-like isoform X1 [Phoenix dactylifera]